MYIWSIRFSLPIKRLLDWTKWLWNQPETSSKPAAWLAFSWYVQFSLVAQLCPTLWPHGPQHARPPCPSPTPGVYPNSRPSSWWCHPTISSSVVPFSLLPSIFCSIRVFSNQSVLRIMWPKYWSFSLNISPSNEHSGLLSIQFSIGIELAFNLYWILFTW